MSHKLPDLPYALAALEPLLSREALEYHHGKHHKAYVDNLNKLIVGTEFASMNLVDTVKSSSGVIFNNSAQAWNHEFYWHCLSPHSSGKPNNDLFNALGENFRSLEDFKKDFSAAAMSVFGSGWAWLVQEADAQGNNFLKIITAPNADTPLTNSKQTILLACDVWEHAYYIDYRNARNRYLEVFWDLVNWEFVAQNLAKK